MTEDEARATRAQSVLYHVMAHHKPAQLERLVGRLAADRSPGSATAVLIDRSAPDLAGLQAAAGSAENVSLTRTAVSWGDRSFFAPVVAAWTDLLEKYSFEWLTLLSGQCYPVRPVPEFEQFLAGTAYDGFAEVAWSGSPKDAYRWDRKAQDLYSRYWYSYRTMPDLGTRLNSVQMRAGWKLNEIAAPVGNVVSFRSLGPGRPPSLGVRRMSTPFDGFLEFRHGSPWITVRRKALERLCSALAPGSPLLRYFSRTLIPAEAAWVSLLMGNSDLDIAPHNLHYIKWDSRFSPHPRVLTSGDLQEMLASDAYFARKFDLGIDGTVLDHLDCHIASSI